MKFEYPMRFTRSRTGCTVTCRDLPEAITQAAHMADAVEAAEGALQAALEARMDDGLEIPAPTPSRSGERRVVVPPETALKAALHLAMRGAGVNRSELARRRGKDEKVVRRLLDPRHSSRIGSVAEMARALGCRVCVEIVTV